MASKCSECGRAVYNKRELTKLDSSGKVFELMRGICSAQQEELHVLLVDIGLKLIKKEMVAKGQVTQCHVSARDIFRAALECNAVGLVLVHNHPSGDPTPSTEDRDLTRRVRSAADLLDLKFIDHVIVGGDGYYSFAESDTNTLRGC